MGLLSIFSLSSLVQKELIPTPAEDLGSSGLVQKELIPTPAGDPDSYSLVQKELIPTLAGDLDESEKQNNAFSEDHQAVEGDIYKFASSVHT